MWGLAMAPLEDMRLLFTSLYIFEKRKNEGY
jgi:hypothetical protein